MLSNLNERDRKALRFGAIGAGGILFMMLVVFPASDYWDRLSREKTAKLDQIRAAEAGILDQVTARQELEKLRRTATLYPDRTGLNQQTARLIQQVQELPGYAGLAVRRLEGLPLREEEGYFRSALSLQFTARLADLHRFAQAVEKTTPALKIERLTLMGGEKDRSRVEGQLQIVAYAVVTGQAPGASSGRGAGR